MKGAGDRALLVAVKRPSPTADNPTVTATLSPPVRIVAALGALAAVGLAVFFFLLGRPTGETDSLAAPIVRPTTPATQQTPKPAAAKPRAATPATPKSGFPLPVDRALKNRRVVVVALYVPGASVDAVVRKEARAGAIAAGAAYVAIPATNSRLVEPLIAKTGVLPEPAVVVVKRPGVVAATFGVTDRELVAQAALQAKKR
jgi:hypothetical protein